MALIDNEEAARRLARVIISDIELYEKKKIQAGDDLTAPMAEGRALFHRRVVPELAAIFEAVVEMKRSGAATGGPSTLTPPPLGTAPSPTVFATTTAPVTRAPSDAPPATDEPVARMRTPEAPVGQARFEDARPADAVLSEPTAPTDLTAEAAATRNPDVSAGRTQGRDLWQDHEITPVQLENVAAGRSGTPDEPAITWAGRPPEAAPEESSNDDRVTSPAAFAAVTTTLEEPPIVARPAARPLAPPPPHTPAPSRASSIAPLASTPVPLARAAAATPQPIVVRREPPPFPREAADKTPVPLSVSLAPAATSVRPPASPPPAAAPALSVAALPSDAVAPPAASDDIVNLRAKTSKVRVLLYVVATAGGLALIGRFLTRFL
jgi:hypothetical protein